MTAAGGLIYVFGGEELTEDLEGRWISEWGHGDTLVWAVEGGKVGLRCGQ